MRKQQVWNTALEQFTKDFCCTKEDLSQKKVVVTTMKQLPGQRLYDPEPYPLRGYIGPMGAVLCVEPGLEETFRQEFQDVNYPWLFHINNLEKMDAILYRIGYKLTEMRHYFLAEVPPPYTKENTDLSLRWYEGEDLLQFKGDKRFSHALMFDSKFPDEIAVVAEENGEIMGMAGASSDGENLWQVGIDIMPEHGGKKLGSKLVSLVREEVENRGKTLFYGTTSGHVVSQRVALSTGYLPAWVEIASQPK